MPEVPSRSHNAIVRHMENIGATYSKHGLETRMMRTGEVLVVSVPASTLFDANSTELRPDAPRVLNAFSQIIKLPGSYKVLVVAHTDDTGAELYADNLTEARANAVDSFYTATIPDITLNLVPYGVGNDEPRATNHSIAGRAANRRIEFIIIPEKETIARARAGKL